MSPINLKELILKKPYLNLYFQGSFESRGTYALNKTKGREEYYVSVEGKNLASSVAPKISALRMIGETKIRETDLVVVFGLGNPHLIQILNEKIAPNQIIHQKKFFLAYGIISFIRQWKFQDAIFF